MDTLRFMGVNKDTTTAGPGKRLEFFTKGCIRGVIAPCQGCFNQETWTFEGKYRGLTINEVVDICVEDAWNRQVTFCGGEPILQARALTQVARRLKMIDPTFHFVMYTAYKLDTLMKHGLKFTWVQKKHGDAMFDALYDYCYEYEVSEYDEGFAAIAHFTILTPNDVKELMQYIDIIVDGDYQFEKRLTTSQYMHEGWFVGSSNQRVIFAPASIKTGELKYLQADEYNKQRAESAHCKCCGHEIKYEPFCGTLCSMRYEERKNVMSLIGVM